MLVLIFRASNKEICKFILNVITLLMSCFTALERDYDSDCRALGYFKSTFLNHYVTLRCLYGVIYVVDFQCY